MKTETEIDLLMGGAVDAPAGALTAGSVVEFMVMPAGDQSGTFKRGVPGGATRADSRTVRVDRATAATLQEQLKAANGRGLQRAYFDFDHEDKTAAAWPVAFVWRDQPSAGVYARAELSSAGAEAIAGKNYRAFSPVIYVDRGSPSRVKCNPEADLNFGGFVNDPAFKELSPLWAKNGAGALNTGASDADNQLNTMKEKLVELQTTVKTLETEITQLKAKNAKPEDAAAHTAELRTKESDLRATKAELQVETLQAKNVEFEKAEKARKEKYAKDAVDEAIKAGLIAPKDEALQGKYLKLIAEDEGNIVLLAGLPKKPILGERITDAGAVTRLEAKEGPKRLVQAYDKLAASNRAIRGTDPVSLQEKGRIAREMACLYAHDMSGKREFLDMPLMGALDTDTLGTISGTLVMQRTLEFFRINYPIFKAIYSDFSDQPAFLNQVIATRKVSKPAVQTYSATLGADGRPQGWTTASAATTTDATITIDEHVGVPIVFDANTMASTSRRLFDEQAPAQAYALASYFVAKVYGKFTAANYNAYAAVNGAKVPVAYVTYAKGVLDFARSAFVDLNAIFNPNEVPLHDRFVLLNSQYYAAAGKDPSLVTFWAPNRDPELITEGELPRMSKFTPIEAPDFPATNNRVGFAGQKSAIGVASRIPADYTKALPGASYGTATMISDAETGMTIMMVEYVNHTGGYAERRLETMIGAGVMDTRAGLVLTSQ